MDPFTHAVLGGTTAALSSRSGQCLRVAVLCGVVAGMAPDLDVLIKEAGNPMFGLKFHRFFTHALAFVPFGALLVVGFLRYVLRLKLSFGAIYLACLSGFGMHGLLDAMTNYGTHLFWPFTMRRESWSIISIIDPIFTLTLLAFLIAALITRTKRYALMGFAFALCYWSLGYYQNGKATQAMQALAQSRGHVVERAEVKPSFGNIIVWRVQYSFAGRVYIDAVHVSPWRGTVVYEGGSLPSYVMPSALSPVQQQDMDYFNFFSDGWLAEAPRYPGLIGDVRFSMLPNQLDPIWGIRLQPEAPEQHVLFENVRTRTPGDVGVLLKMIRGEAL